MHLKILGFLLCISGIATAQWSDFETLYEDGQTKVEITFKTSDESCNLNGKQHKLKYRISKLKSQPDYYVVWKMDYVGCNGIYYTQSRSLNIGSNGVPDIVYSNDDFFTAESISNFFYESRLSRKKEVDVVERKAPASKVAEKIIGPSQSNYRQSVELSVSGGSLGENADWKWYQDGCGKQPVGIGKTITVSPAETTTYFVRAEGSNNTTDCVSKTLLVNTEPLAPKGISGESTICFGESTTLNVSGGFKGLKGSWVWYSGACGDTKVGTGVSLRVNPKVSSTYFVRAEGEGQSTECARLTVTVTEKSLQAAGIDGPKAVCEGQRIELRVDGGKLAPGAKWKWYSANCGGTEIGEGEIFYTTAIISQYYYVRAEGACNSTACISHYVAVDRVVEKPQQIYVPSTVKRGEKINLSIYKENIGEDASYVWYEGECGEGEMIGTGSQISVKPAKKGSDYYVRAEGACNTSDCATTSIVPFKVRQMDPTYVTDIRQNKFLHVGLGVGLDFMSFESAYSPSTSQLSTLDTARIFGTGLKLELAFHPLFKDNISYGINASAALGTFPLPWGFQDEAKRKRYGYSRFELENELCFGFSGLKALGMHRISLQNHDFVQVTSDGSNSVSQSLNSTLRKEVLGVGLRFGSYSKPRGKNKGLSIDFIYYLWSDYDWEWNNPAFSYINLSEWSSGVGLVIWSQSTLKMRLDVLSDQSSFSSPDPSGRGYYQFSLIYNRNGFY